MFASFTSGTYAFLRQLTKKQTKYTFYFMKSSRTTVAYYEHKRKKSIFVSGKTFIILSSFHQFQQKGFMTMEHIPVTDDGAKIFEERLINLFPELTRRRGVVAMRLLTRRKQNEFVLMTQWENERVEEKWRDSPMYDYQNVQQYARLSAYFANRPFTNKYMMIDDEGDLEND